MKGAKGPWEQSMSFGEWLAMLVLVTESYSSSQEVLRLCFILSLSAGAEISENAPKGDNIDRAALVSGFVGHLPSELWNAMHLFISGSYVPAHFAYLCFLYSPACHWHLINVKK